MYGERTDETDETKEAMVESRQTHYKRLSTGKSKNGQLLANVDP
jgi:hypothetical protein